MTHNRSARLSKSEIDNIREIVGPRMDAYKAGTLEVIDFDTVFDEIEAQFFNQPELRA